VQLLSSYRDTNECLYYRVCPLFYLSESPILIIISIFPLIIIGFKKYRSQVLEYCGQDRLELPKKSCPKDHLYYLYRH
jgi:hypothetical protein